MRDIHRDPSDPDVIFVADGGRRNTSDVNCSDTLVDSVIYQVDYDADTVTEVDPGNLLPPTGDSEVDGQSLVGFDVDKSGAWIYALYPSSVNPAATACSTNSCEKVWRYEIDVGSWEAADAYFNTATMSIADTWLFDQEDPDRWAPRYAYDIYLMDSAGAPTPSALLSDGYGIWQIDDYTEVDPADLIWGFVADDFQTTVANDIAVHQTGASSDEVWAAVSDLGIFALTPTEWTSWTGADRGVVNCGWYEWAAGGAVAAYGSGTLLMGMVDQTDSEGTGSGHAIFKSTDQGETFCYIPTDTQYTGSVTCDNSNSDSFSLDPCYTWSAYPLDDLGAPVALTVVQPTSDHYVAAFYKDAIMYTDDGGETWTEVPFPTSPWTSGCDDTLDFLFTGVQIIVHPDTNLTASPDHYRILVSSGHSSGACGLVSVEWDAGSEGSATWTPYNTATSCYMNRDLQRGAESPRWGRDLVYVYGNYHYRSWDSTDNGGVCEVDLAGSPDYEQLGVPMNDLTGLAFNPRVAGLVYASSAVKISTECDEDGAGNRLCDVPGPYAYEKVRGQWTNVPLDTTALPSLVGNEIEWGWEGTKGSVVYATANSGVYRGTLSF